MFTILNILNILQQNYPAITKPPKLHNKTHTIKPIFYATKPYCNYPLHFAYRWVLGSTKPQSPRFIHTRTGNSYSGCNGLMGSDPPKPIGRQNAAEGEYLMK